MSDARRRRQAKQARRDARRAREHHLEAPEEAPLVDEVREALASGNPLELLGLVSMLILAAAPDPLAAFRSDPREPVRLDELVTAFIGVKLPETTALLAVLGELLVGDEMLQVRCRREVAARNDVLPPWLENLAQAHAYRAVRMTHVLGDGDEVLIGVRFADGAEVTCAAFIDHDIPSEVKDAFFVPTTIESVLAVGAQHNTDPDTSFIDMTLADARAWVDQGLERAAMLPPLDESDSWPGCRALVRWVIQGMPAGGAGYEEPYWDSTRLAELFRKFFGSLPGMPFDDYEHWALLEGFVESGTGDPLRWSAARIERLLNSPLSPDAGMSVDSLLDAPDLMRAYVPFAHAESGIRLELTAEALAVIDDLEMPYRSDVLGATEQWEEDDDLDV